MERPIKTRIPPSPTGEPHVGNLRTALFNYLYAKKHGGTFLIRIEDTDRERSEEKYTRYLLEGFKWAGIETDEGVYIDENGKIKEKGKNGPYTQSKRFNLYKKYAKELLDKDKAYYCFCTAEDLDKMRKQQAEQKKPPLYDGRCRNKSKQEAGQLLKKGAPHVIRLKMPKQGKTVFNDLIRGEVSFENALIDDQVLLKSDGFPTYHLANVIDDYLMGITLVMRGEEWVPSTPKHIVLYEAFGFEKPRFAHLPLVLAKDKSKLSKRHGAVSVMDFKEQGYLPQALINFLALLGWNPGTEQEIFSMAELEKVFDIDKVQKSPAVFNYEKLNWMNKEYIKNMNDDLLIEKLKPYLVLKDKERNKKIVRMLKQRMEKLSDFEELSLFLYEDLPKYNPEILVFKKLRNQEHALAKTKQNLEKSVQILEKINPEEFISENMRDLFSQFCEQENINRGEILWPLRVSVTGMENSPDVFDVIEILGLKISKNRIQSAIEKLN